MIPPMRAPMLALCILIAVSVALEHDSYCIVNKAQASGSGSCAKGDIFLKGKYIELGINNVGSYGTKENAPSSYVYKGQKLGFIADYDKNGFSGSPGYSGDYFVPGIPLEGWVLQWTSSSGKTSKYVNEGLMNRTGILPTTFSVTSTDTTQSSLWIGRAGDVEATVSTRFNNDDLFFTTTVTLQNVGSDVLSDLYCKFLVELVLSVCLFVCLSVSVYLSVCLSIWSVDAIDDGLSFPTCPADLRTVDPDQAKVYYNDYKTRNYVKYQPKASDGSDASVSLGYVHPTQPNTALVCATTSLNYNFFLGLGTIHPNARVSHFGFDVDTPPVTWSDGGGSSLWKQYGGKDVEPTAAYLNRMRLRDEAVHLTFKFPAIHPKEIVQFSFAYVLNAADLSAAMLSVSALTIVQPTLEVSGSRVDFSVVASTPFVRAEFFIFAVRSASPSAPPAWHKLGDASFIGVNVRHTIIFSSFEFVDGDVQLRVAASTVSGEVLVASKAAKVLNTGTLMEFTHRPGAEASNCSALIFRTSTTTTLTMTKLTPTDPDPINVLFFREALSADGQNMFSVAIGTATSAPYTVTVSVDDLVDGQHVVIKALVDNGHDMSQATICGHVRLVNRPPSALSLSGSVIAENSRRGTVIGTLSSSDPDNTGHTASSHTYELLDNGGGLFAVLGNQIVVGGAVDYEALSSASGEVSIRVQVSDGGSDNCCLEKDFALRVTDINEVPVASDVSLSISEDAAIGTVIHQLKVTDPDPADSHTFALASSSPYFAVSSSTGTVSVKAALPPAAQVLTHTLTVSILDSGFPALSTTVQVLIKITKVNSAPTGVVFIPAPSNGDCDGVSENNTAIGTVVGHLHAIDVDSNDTHTFVVWGCEGWVFAVDRDTGAVTVVAAFDDVSKGDGVQLQVLVSDGAGASVTRDLTISICAMSVNPTVSPDVLWCFVDENREVGDTLMSLQPGVESFVCKILASSNDGTALSFEIISDNSRSGNYQGAFWVQECSGVLFIVGSVDYEDHNEYSVTIAVTSEGGGRATVELLIFVVDINEAPLLTPATTIFSVQENSPKDTIVIPSLLSDVTDPDLPSSFTFDIVSGNGGGVFYFCDKTIGKLCTSSVPTNYESTRIYYLLVVVTDQGGLTSSGEYVVSVRDVNEPPVCVQSSGMFANVVEQPEAGTALGTKLTFTDDDVNQTLSVSITSGNVDGLFAIQSFVQGAATYYHIVTTEACCSPTALPMYYKLQLTVTDDGDPVESNTCSYGVNVSIIIPKPPDPTLPTFLSFNVDENSPRGTAVGVPLLSVFGNGSVAGKVHFGITDYTDDGVRFFRIDELTGQIIVDKASLNYEIISAFQYVITATFTNSDGLVTTSDCVVDISVGNVDDAPVFEVCVPGYLDEYTGVSGTRDVMSSGDIVIYEALDEDSATLTFTIEAVNGNKGPSATGMFDMVSIDAKSFTLQSAHEFDFEERSSYTVRLSVTDGTSTVYTDCVITIVNVNEAPVTNATVPCFASYAAAGGFVMCSVIMSDEDSPSDPNQWGSLTFSLSQTLAGVHVIPQGTRGVSVVLTQSAAANGWAEGQVITGLVVRGTDGGGLFAESSVSITVLAEYDPPRCPTGDMYAHAYEVDEGTEEGETIGFISGGDPVLQVTDAHPVTCEIMNGNMSQIFAIGPDCTLMTGRTPLDYEAKDMYELLVRATEVKASPLSSWCTVWVRVRNVEEGCVVDANQVFYVDENIAAGLLTVNGNPIEPMQVDDLEQDGLSGVFSASCEGAYCVNDDEDIFDIDASSGHWLLRAGKTINFERRATYNYTVRYAYRGHDIFAAVTLRVLDVNEPPTIRMGDVTVAETPIAGSLGFIQAYDPDYEDVVDFSASSCRAACGLTYHLVSPLGPFEVDPTSGEIQLLSGGIDYEAKTFYEVSLMVTDEHGAMARTTITVHVSDVPDCVVTSVVNATLAPLSDSVFDTQGGQVIYISGRNFGPSAVALTELGLLPTDISALVQLQSDAEASLSAHVFAMECEMHGNVLQFNTRLRCVLPAGVSAGLGLVVTILHKGVAVATSPFFSAHVSYSPPSIQTIDSTGRTVTLTGANLGTASEINVVVGTYRNSYFTNHVTCSVEVAHTQVKCVTTDCYGTAISWSVTVGGQVSNTMANVATCGTPTVTRSSGAVIHALNTAGGEVFYLSGSNFGDVNDNIRVTYGATGVEYSPRCVVHIAGSMLQCTSTPGAGQNLTVVVSVADKVSTQFPHALSYTAPAITAVYGPGIISTTAGGEVFYLSGTNFGPVTSSPWAVAVTYGGVSGQNYQALQCRVTVAHSTAQCVMVPGTGAHLTFRIIISSQPSAPFVSTATYLPPSIAHYNTYPSPSTGGHVVYIYGQNFGDYWVEVDRISAVDFSGMTINMTHMCSYFTPHEVIKCNLPSGISTVLTWTIVVNGQTSAETSSSSSPYDPPFITALSGAGVRGASVYGGDTINITGGNFGPPLARTAAGAPFLEWVKYGPTGVEYTAKSCKVIVGNVITCLTAQGVGANLVWRVRIHGQDSAPSVVVSSYAAPNITAMVPSVGGNTDGTTVVTLHGTNIATFATPVVLFNGDAVPCTVTLRDVVTFLAPEVANMTRATFPVQVGVGGQFSQQVLFTYADPFIHSVNILAHSTNGSLTLTIIGSSFTLKPVVKVARDGQTVHPSCSLRTHAEISCVVSLKRGSVTVSTPHATSNALTYYFGEPLLLHSARLSGGTSTTGHTPSNPAVLYLLGQNMGSSISDFRVYIENTQTYAQSTCDIVDFTYTSKIFHTAQWNAIAKWVVGEDEGMDFQQVTCRLPPGEGAGNSIKIARGASVSLGCGCEACRGAACFSYAAPYVTNIISPCGDRGCDVVACDSNDDDDDAGEAGEWWSDDGSDDGNDDHIFFDDDYRPDHTTSSTSLQAPGKRNVSSRRALGISASIDSSASPDSVVDDYCNSVAACGSPDGDFTVVLVGMNFGIAPKVMVGDKEWEILKSNHTHIVLNGFQDVGKYLLVTVLVGNQRNLLPFNSDVPNFCYFSYYMPHVNPGLSSLLIGNTGSNGTVTITGKYFGPMPPVVHLGSNQLTVLNSSQTTITVLIPPGQGCHYALSVTAGGQIAYSPDAFCYRPPRIDDVLCSGRDDGKCLAATHGGPNSNVTIRIIGQNFGWFNLSWDIYVGPYVVRSPDIISWSNTAIEFYPPAGCGRNLRLRLKVGRQRSTESTTFHFSYLPPVITDAVLPTVLETAGGNMITLLGENFGKCVARVYVYDRSFKANPPMPTPRPTSSPTYSPTPIPTATPSAEPSPSPTHGPTIKPSPYPSQHPTTQPSLVPTAAPSVAPTPSPTATPTSKPSTQPTEAPTRRPTSVPTLSPTREPTRSPATPNDIPTSSPSIKPTPTPTTPPSPSPTKAPSRSPTPSPTRSPTKAPTAVPSRSPTPAPSKEPTPLPVAYYARPTPYPTPRPTPSKREKTEKPTKEKSDKSDKSDKADKADKADTFDDDFFPTDDDRYIKGDKKDDRRRTVTSESTEEEGAWKRGAGGPLKHEDDDDIVGEGHGQGEQRRFLSSHRDMSWTHATHDISLDMEMASDLSPELDEEEVEESPHSPDFFHVSDTDMLRSKQDVFLKYLPPIRSSFMAPEATKTIMAGVTLSETMSEDEYRYMDPVAVQVTSQTHSSLQFILPPGAGSNLLLLLVVGNQRTAVPFSYSPPTVTRYYMSRGGSALGNELLRVYGTNFGAIDSPVAVYINDTVCQDPVRNVDDKGESYIECTTAPTTVGSKNVRVEVGFHIVDSNVPYRVECKKRSFGAEGEMCSLCREGYVCNTDGLEYPKSAWGFYMTDVAIPSDMCPPESQVKREECPAALACMPRESCIGNNECSLEYTSERCAQCRDNYYRINGRCVRCPEAPWAIFLAAVLVLSSGIYIAYKLNQKNVSIGILSIGVDYMQVLGIFGTARVNWPNVVIDMYNIFSIFNLNIDVFAPKCWGLITFEFREKWITIALMPVIALAICIPVVVVYGLVMRTSRQGHVPPTGQHRASLKHQVISVYLMLFYYGYVMLANNTFAVFNCQPTEPSDGHKYMAEVGADGGLCYADGTLQQKLKPWAVLCFIVYVLGFPLLVGYILFANKDKIMTAQVMQAARSRRLYKNEKISTFRFRMMFSRLYYQFKPDYYYWVFCIITRKFALTVSAVVFRENIVFLLSLYVLILFAAYTMQVGYRPYMSLSEYPDVVVENAYLLPQACQQIIASSMQQVQLKKSARRKRLGGSTPLFTVLTPRMAFFNDYNTVEAALLLSAILVCIGKPYMLSCI